MDVAKEKILKENPYLRKGEHQFLMGIVSQLKKNADILEIGTFKGQTAIFIAKIRKDINIITIDNHVGIPEEGFYSSKEEVDLSIKYNGLSSQITHHMISSQAFFPKKKFDLIFIDGDHSYEGVKFDFEKFKQYLKEDGTIIIHDCKYIPGVTKFCSELNIKEQIIGNSIFLVRHGDIFG